MGNFKVEFIEDYGLHKIGDKVTLTSYFDGSLINFKGKRGNGTALESRFKLTDKPNKNQRITSLEADLAATKEEVAELKLIVQQLGKASKVVEEALAQVAYETIIEFEGKQYKKVDRVACEGDIVKFTRSHTKTTANKPYEVINGFHYKNDIGEIDCRVYGWGGKSTYVTFELIESSSVEDKPAIAIEKSLNQLRTEVVEMAKGFVKKKSQGIHFGAPVVDNKNLKYFGVLAVHFGLSDELEFVVNSEKRTVVALIRTITSKRLSHRGIAKCDPSDVFNEHIGNRIRS